MAIGIDIMQDAIHALYLRRRGETSGVAGYAASQNVAQTQLSAQVVRVIRALDVPEDTPVGLSWSASADDAQRDEVAAALRQAGYEFTSEDHAVAIARSLPAATAADGPDDDLTLVDCDIPVGLLQAHPGLTPRDLAGAAGVALGMLGLGQSAAGSTVTTWSPDESASDEPAPTSPAAPASPTPPAAPTPLAPTPPAPTPRAPAVAAATPAPSAFLGGAGFKPGMVLGALGLLIVVGLLLGFCGSGGDDSADNDAAPVPVATVTPQPVPTPEPTATAAPEPTATPEPEPTATPEPEPTATPQPEPEPTAAPEPTFPPLASLGERAAIFRPPTLFLQGPVPDQATIDALYSRAVEVLGEENVVNEYVVHPDAPPIAGDESGIRVEAAVLFQSGSAAIAPDFIPVLELAVTLFTLNPQMTAIVQGHTDAVGSAEVNQTLSESRANAVLEYLVSRGVERERLTAIGFGLERPVADNSTEQGRQLNRRIEFDLEGLLDPRP